MIASLESNIRPPILFFRFWNSRCGRNPENMSDKRAIRRLFASRTCALTYWKSIYFLDRMRCFFGSNFRLIHSISWHITRLWLVFLLEMKWFWLNHVLVKKLSQLLCWPKDLAWSSSTSTRPGKLMVSTAVWCPLCCECDFVHDCHKMQQRHTILPSCYTIEFLVIYKWSFKIKTT